MSTSENLITIGQPKTNKENFEAAKERGERWRVGGIEEVAIFISIHCFMKPTLWTVSPIASFLNLAGENLSLGLINPAHWEKSFARPLTD